MADDPHRRADPTVKFCTTRARPKCGDVSKCADYIDVCKPNWSGHTFEKLVNAATGPRVDDKRYEAHHLVCISPATKDLLGNGAIRGAIEQTEWCINNKKNMKAMPLWGHTVKWYCTITAAVVPNPLSAISKKKGPPKFKDIPQHDIDHNSEEGYTFECKTKVKELAKEVAASGHKLQGSSLVDKLDGLAKEFTTLLRDRGKRKDGTHNAWQLAQDFPNDHTWIHPFSMASDKKVGLVGFPVRTFNDKLEQWVNRIQNAIAGP